MERFYPSWQGPDAKRCAALKADGMGCVVKRLETQNRLGYLVHLAGRTTRALPENAGAAQVLSRWECELEEARLAREGTLCRDCMPVPERVWPRAKSPGSRGP